MITNISEFKTTIITESIDPLTIQTSLSDIMEYYRNEIKIIDTLSDTEYSTREDEKNKYVEILRYLTLASNEL